MDDRERRSVRDRKGGFGKWRCEAPPGQAGLLLAQCGERCLHRSLETLLDDELRLAVAQQDECAIQTLRN
jgi:hypothetical protein